MTQVSPAIIAEINTLGLQEGKRLMRHSKGWVCPVHRTPYIRLSPDYAPMCAEPGCLVRGFEFVEARSAEE